MGSRLGSSQFECCFDPEFCIPTWMTWSYSGFTWEALCLGDASAHDNHPFRDPRSSMVGWDDCSPKRDVLQDLPSTCHALPCSIERVRCASSLVLLKTRRGERLQPAWWFDWWSTADDAWSRTARHRGWVGSWKSLNPSCEHRLWNEPCQQ